MIARIIIPIIIAIVLPDIYFDQLYGQRIHRGRWLRRLLWWLPGTAMLCYSVALASIRNFVPDDLTWINVYLLLVGLVVVPKALFALCSAAGLLWCRFTHTRRNHGHAVAAVLTAFTWFMVVYGSTVGPEQLVVKRLDLYFDRLPRAFEGYRIVQFSDAHVGSFTGSRRALLLRDIDSINAQHPDLIAFTGDLQNIKPTDIYPVGGILARLHARDGVVAVMGNHDYAEYVHESPAVERRNIAATMAAERKCGWRLLLNEHMVVRRGADSIVVAGEENYDRPRRGSLSATLAGASRDAFTVLLEHQPRAWREEALPSGRIDLMLAGHTHGGQMSIFGLRPTQISEPNDLGLFERDGRMLYVNAGLGGLVPFRFAMPAEVTVLTLHKANP